MDNELIPSYLEGDYQTSFTKLQRMLQNSDSFKDYNYQGSNITMIMELMSYLADFNSYHTNMIAKNMYTDTAEIYETVHRLVSQKGYTPKGYISAQGTFTITVSGASVDDGDQIYIAPWQSIGTGLSTDDGNDIIFTNTEHLYTTLTTDTSGASGSVDHHTFNLIMREGEVEEVLYRGEDIIDNQIILPFKNFDHGQFPFNTPSISLSINDTEWLRINDFYDDISGLTDETEVYRFLFDKYQRYTINFASSRKIPQSIDDIRILTLISNGNQGGVGSKIITKNSIDLSNFIIFNITKGVQVPLNDILVFTNNEATTSGNLPETVTELKVNSSVSAHSQFRNITKVDYKSTLESNSSIIKGYAWGEQESNPGNTLEYNKIYFCVTPNYGIDTYFANGTINTEKVLWVDTDTPSISAYIDLPISYNTEYTNEVLQFLEPYKMINVYEVPVLPELVYFRFNIGIRLKRMFNYQDVVTDVKNKLNYFFNVGNRNYHEIVSFMDIHNYIMDTSIESPDDSFKYIKGINNLVIRELKTYTQSISGNEEFIYEPNEDFNFPHFTKESYESYIDNELRPIQLGFKQFPVVSLDACMFELEV